MNYDIDELFKGAVRLNTEEMEKRRIWEEANKGFELRMLDIVRIEFGTVGVVAGLNGSKDASLAFSGDSTGHKVAWWHPSELQVIGNVQDWVLQNTNPVLYVTNLGILEEGDAPKRQTGKP